MLCRTGSVTVTVGGRIRSQNSAFIFQLFDGFDSLYLQLIEWLLEAVQLLQLYLLCFFSAVYASINMPCFV